VANFQSFTVSDALSNCGTLSQIHEINFNLTPQTLKIDDDHKDDPYDYDSRGK
jgi:hypothetical protein